MEPAAASLPHVGPSSLGQRVGSVDCIRAED